MSAAEYSRPESAAPASYHTTRFTYDRRRAAVWHHLAKYLSRFVSPDARLLELGAGYCHFVNAVAARERVAVDTLPDLPQYVAPGVTPVVQDAMSYLDHLRPGSFDVVFASNFLEHFVWSELDHMAPLIHRALAPKGRLILLQPNFRLAPGRYFDDFTHRTIFTDVSLSDWLRTHDFGIANVVPRFMPLTVKSRFSGLSFLVPIYLRMPWKPFAGQMLVIAERQ